MDWRYSPLVEKRRFTKFEAWIDLLLLASHKDHVHGDIDIMRGQLLTSQKNLAERWKWDRRTVRNFLNECQKRGEIVHQPATNWSLVTICKYDSYQGDSPPECSSDSPSKSHQSPTINNGKEWKRKNGGDEKKSSRHSEPPVNEDWLIQQRLRPESAEVQ